MQKSGKEKSQTLNKSCNVNLILEQKKVGETPSTCRRVICLEQKREMMKSIGGIYILTENCLILEAMEEHKQRGGETKRERDSRGMRQRQRNKKGNGGAVVTWPKQTN